MEQFLPAEFAQLRPYLGYAAQLAERLSGSSEWLDAAAERLGAIERAAPRLHALLEKAPGGGAPVPS